MDSLTNDESKMSDVQDIDVQDAETEQPRLLSVVLTISQLVQLHACAMEGLWHRRDAGHETALVQESMEALTTALVADQTPLTALETGALIGVAKTHLGMMKIAGPDVETTPEYSLLQGAVHKLEGSPLASS